MTTFYLVLWLSAGVVVMPQQYYEAECLAAGKASGMMYACVKAPK